MNRFLRSAALVASVLLIGYGLLTTASHSSAAWLLILAVVFVLLLYALQPRLPQTVPGVQSATVRVLMVFLIAFVLVSVQLVRIQVVDSHQISRAYASEGNEVVVMDPRRRIEAADVDRGSLLTRDGQVMAETLVADDGSRQRVYPSPTTAYLAGYYSPLLYGSSNLEASFDGYLMGREGGNPVSQWLDGILHRNTRGYDVHLTLDSRLQALGDQLLGDRKGAVVLMDAKTGAVLALVSKPNFDPNKLYVGPGADSSQQVAAATDYWQQITSSQDAPLVLRATEGLYPPGSVFKTVTASAALETGTAQPSSVYRDEGALTVDSRVIQEENRPDPNKVSYTLSEAYGYSLNVVFAQVGLQLGQKLVDFANRFGFGDAIPFDLPVQASHVFSDPAFIASRPGQATTAFGQGQLTATPLQVALFGAAVVNGGQIATPHLLASVTAPEGKTLLTRGTEIWQRAVSEQTASEMRQMMIQSVESGYALDAQIPGRVVGGKTGTAEVGNGDPHAWFLGFIDGNDTSYVVSVVVENGGSGGKVALPIGRELLKAAAESPADGVGH